MQLHQGVMGVKLWLLKIKNGTRSIFFFDLISDYIDRKAQFEYIFGLIVLRFRFLILDANLLQTVSNVTYLTTFI